MKHQTTIQMILNLFRGQNGGGGGQIIDLRPSWNLSLSLLIRSGAFRFIRSRAKPLSEAADLQMTASYAQDASTNAFTRPPPSRSQPFKVLVKAPHQLQSSPLK